MIPYCVRITVLLCGGQPVKKKVWSTLLWQCFALFFVWNVHFERKWSDKIKDDYFVTPKRLHFLKHPKCMEKKFSRKSEWWVCITFVDLAGLATIFSNYLRPSRLTRKTVFTSNKDFSFWDSFNFSSEGLDELSSKQTYDFGYHFWFKRQSNSQPLVIHLSAQGRLECLRSEAQGTAPNLLNELNLRTDGLFA